MIFLRRFLCIFILFVGVCSHVKASTDASPEKRAEVITQWMKQKLELSSQQITLVASLNLKFEKEIDSVTKSNQGFTCMKAVRDTLKRKEKELKRLFSVHQFETYQKGKCDLKEKLKRCVKGSN